MNETIHINKYYLNTWKIETLFPFLVAVNKSVHFDGSIDINNSPPCWRNVRAPRMYVRPEIPDQRRTRPKPSGRRGSVTFALWSWLLQQTSALRTTVTVLSLIYSGEVIRAKLPPHMCPQSLWTLFRSPRIDWHPPQSTRGLSVSLLSNQLSYHYYGCSGWAKFTWHIGMDDKIRRANMEMPP